MATNPLAISAFLDRPRANSDKAKRFGLEALRKKAERADLRFALPPYRHQLATALLNLRHGSYFDLLDMGLGKTAIVLAVFATRRRAGKSRRMLVLVPGVSNIGGWAEEVRIHAPGLSFLGVDEQLVGEDRRRAILDGDQAVVCLTYQGWLRLICDDEPAKQKGKRKWRINPAKAGPLEGCFEEVVFDESDAIRNHQSLLFRSARRLGALPFRTCLTGTPFNRDPAGLWSQFFVIDRGESLGETLGLFRAAFFVEGRNHWSGGPTWAFDRRMEPDLYRCMRHRSIRWSEAECLDLPPKVGGITRPVVRSVVMPRETWAYHERLAEEFRASQGNYSLLEGTYARLRMLCSGYLRIVDKESGERQDIIMRENPKMDALVDLLREIDVGSKKVIVFCEYQKTGALIADRMVAEGIPAVRLYGGTSGKGSVIERFKTDAKVRVLIASRSGAKGHNLQHACHHMIFFESPDDVSTRTQAEKRIRRPGQTRTTYYFDLLTKGSVEERILRALGQGKRLFDLLVDGKASL